MKTLVRLILGCGGCVALAIAAVFANNFALDRAARANLAGDTRNDLVRYELTYLVPWDRKTIVFNLKDVEPTGSALDVTRVLFQVAEGVSDRDFDRVILAYKGERRFYLQGWYFEEIGRTYSYENPTYLLRTMPENTFEMDGDAAFERWQGGLLGVATRQLEDFNTLHDRWYRDDLI